jgi:hypothetical protein
MKRAIIGFLVTSAAVLGACGSNPTQEEAEEVGQVGQAIQPPYCEDACGPDRPCDKVCRLADETRTTCGEWRGCPGGGGGNPTPGPCLIAGLPTFSAPPVVFVDEPANFQGHYTNPGLGYPVNWDYGDATHCIQCGLNVEHYYSSLGVKQVRLTATMQGYHQNTGAVCYETRVSQPVSVSVRRRIRQPCEGPGACSP